MLPGRIWADGREREASLSYVFMCSDLQSADASLAFNHIKDGHPFPAQILPISCTARTIIYCPREDLHPDLARMAVVVPDSTKPHAHPPPPSNKLTRAVAQMYKECVRKVGPGATVAKVDKGACICRPGMVQLSKISSSALSTKEILGTTPALYHASLINRDTRTKLVQQVKDETRDSSLAGSTVKQRMIFLVLRTQTLIQSLRGCGLCHGTTVSSGGGTISSFHVSSRQQENYFRRPPKAPKVHT